MESLGFSNDQPHEKGCLNCGNTLIVPGYKNPLCQECRTMLIKFPIPKFIKIFGVIILAVLVLSMSKIHKNLMAGVHLKRGEQAEKKGNYYTAQQEFQKTVGFVPGLKEANCHLMISSIRNLDFATVFRMSEELDGINIEDHSLFNELTNVINTALGYVPSDSFNKVMEQYQLMDSIPELIYQSYIQKFPEEIFPKTSYASFLFAKERYEECEPLLNSVLILNSQHLSALGMKASIKRELKQYDSAHIYCDRMIVYNKESTFGISSKARTFLKQKNDKEGLDWAQRSVKIDKNDPYSMATLAIAFHLNNKIDERNKLVNDAKKDSAAFFYMGYAEDVISGKEKFRD